MFESAHLSRAPFHSSTSSTGHIRAMFIIKCLLLVMTLLFRLTTAKWPKLPIPLEVKINYLEPFESDYKKDVDQICTMSGGLERFLGLLLGTLRNNEQYQKVEGKDKPLAIAQMLGHLRFRGWHQTKHTPAELKIKHIKKLLDSPSLPQDSLQEDEQICFDLPGSHDVAVKTAKSLFRDSDTDRLTDIRFSRSNVKADLNQISMWNAQCTRFCLPTVDLINEIVLQCIQRNCVDFKELLKGRHFLAQKAMKSINKVIGSNVNLETMTLPRAGRRLRLYQLRLQFYLKIAFFKRILVDPPKVPIAEVFSDGEVAALSSSSSRPTGAEELTSLVASQFNTTEGGISKDGTKCTWAIGSLAFTALVAVFAAIYFFLSNLSHFNKDKLTTLDMIDTETNAPTSGWFSSYLLWIAIAVLLLVLLAGVIIWYRRRWISTLDRSSEEVFKSAAPGSKVVSAPGTKEARKKRKPAPKRKQQPVQSKVAPSSNSTVFTSMQRHASASNNTTSTTITGRLPSPLSVPATSAFPKTAPKAAKQSVVFKTEGWTVLAETAKRAGGKKKKKHSPVAKTRRPSSSPQSTPKTNSRSPGNR